MTALLLALALAGPASAVDFEETLRGAERAAKEAAEAAAEQVVEARVVIRGDDQVPAVALTFDDGPGPDTPALLAVLARHRVKATFFMTGAQVHRFPHLARMVAEAGHEVANHTYNHLDFCSLRMRRDIRAAVFRRELERSEEAIVAATGVRPRLMRMPYLCKAPWAERLAMSMGYSVVRWSADGGDWRRPGRDRLADYYLGAAEPGVIMLLHDGGGDRRQTVAAVDRILTELPRRGLRAVTVSELLNARSDAPAAPASAR